MGLCDLKPETDLIIAVMFCLLFLPFVFIGIIAALFFDKVLRIEYEKYHTAWEEDGKPRGFYFIPKEVESEKFSMFGGSSAAFKGLALSWIIETPDWAKSDSKARKSMLLYRIFALISNLGALVVFFTCALIYK